MDPAQLAAGVQVILADAADDDRPTVGRVLEPTELDVTAAREEMGDDLRVCVLVDWGRGYRRWEYTEDLLLAPGD